MSIAKTASDVRYEDAKQPWHARSADAAFASLETDRDGLTASEAARRLSRVGPNRTPTPSAVSPVAMLRAQLASLVVGLLIAAAVVSVLLGDWLDASAILVVLVVNAGIGFTTELRARRAMEALRQFDVSRAAVIRDGRMQTVDAIALVPGDLITLRAGQTVPADARLVEATDLTTSEAALTGESLPVVKDPDRVLPIDTLLAERLNLVYKGTTVVGGVGRALVVATGVGTEIGRVGQLVADARAERTPLERRLDDLGRRLAWLALGVAALVAVIEALQGAAAGVVVQTGLALAVAAVPEGLPAVVTIALAVGVHRMARRHALVRRLPAVEALGSATVVCTDKTRTLTSGDMAVVRVWVDDAVFDLRQPESGHESPALAHALRVAILATATHDGTADDASDPIDLAIARAVMARRGNAAADGPRRPVSVLPFATERRFMANLHDEGGHVVAYVKGAPRTLFDRCTTLWSARGPGPIDQAGRARLQAANDAFAEGGLRVLALASGRVDGAGDQDLRELTFVGLLGLMDPPAPGVAETIARLRSAGLRTVMLTGDQQKTAEAVGRELLLLEGTDRVLDEREFRGHSSRTLVQALDGVGAFSRVTPEDKLAIVVALQSRGEVVAMIGDGVNDAPALKQADVGVAMGRRGTDVARQAADIVLQDDRFATIAAAVEQGRVIADNIRKCVYYLFSCNLAEVLVLLVAGLAGLPPPLTPLQILWLNLVTDTFPALSLALEPPDADVMQRPPANPSQAVLSEGFLSSVGFHGSLLTLATLAAFLWVSVRAPDRATTAAFMTLAFSQIAHLGNARSREAVLSHVRALANPFALGAAAVAVALQTAPLLTPGLGTSLDVVRLSPSDWGIVALLSILPAIIGQLLKLRRGSRRTEDSHAHAS